MHLYLSTFRFSPWTVESSFSNFIPLFAWQMLRTTQPWTENTARALLVIKKKCCGQLQHKLFRNSLSNGTFPHRTPMYTVKRLDKRKLTIELRLKQPSSSTQTYVVGQICAASGICCLCPTRHQRALYTITRVCN